MLQWRLAQQLLVLGQTIILEWGTWRRSERDALRTTARALGAAVELHYMSEAVNVLYDRIQQRGLEDPPVTLRQMQQWTDVFEAPTNDEMALYDDPSRAD